MLELKLLGANSETALRRSTSQKTDNTVEWGGKFWGDLSFLLFFEEVTLNADRYILILQNFLVPELLRRHINKAELWFQPDGATAHRSKPSIEERLGFRTSHFPPCGDSVHPIFGM